MLYNIKYLLVISHSGGYPLSLIVTCELCILCTTPWLFTLKKLCLQNLKLIFLNFFQFLTLNVTIKPMLTLFRMGWGEGGGQKGTPYHFYPCNFNKRSTYLQKLFEFQFQSFWHKVIPSSSPKLLNLNQDHPSKKVIFLIKSL